MFASRSAFCFHRDLIRSPLRDPVGDCIQHSCLDRDRISRLEVQYSYDLDVAVGTNHIVMLMPLGEKVKHSVSQSIVIVLRAFRSQTYACEGVS